jgi:hypothetical protein
MKSPQRNPHLSKAVQRHQEHAPTSLKGLIFYFVEFSSTHGSIGAIIVHHMPKHYQNYLGALVLIESFSTIPRAWWEVL